MKKAIRILFISVLITAASLVFNSAMSQPLPPEGGPDPGQGNTPVGGFVPVGSGLIILLALGAGYGTKKVYDARKKRILE
jgi:hypothetical protein